MWNFLGINSTDGLACVQRLVLSSCVRALTPPFGRSPFSSLLLTRIGITLRPSHVYCGIHDNELRQRCNNDTEFYLMTRIHSSPSSGRVMNDRARLSIVVRLAFILPPASNALQSVLLGFS